MFITLDHVHEDHGNHPFFAASAPAATHMSGTRNLSTSHASQRLQRSPSRRLTSAPDSKVVTLRSRISQRACAWAASSRAIGSSAPSRPMASSVEPGASGLRGTILQLPEQLEHLALDGRARRRRCRHVLGAALELELARYGHQSLVCLLERKEHVEQVEQLGPGQHEGDVAGRLLGVGSLLDRRLDLIRCGDGSIREEPRLLLHTASLDGATAMAVTPNAPASPRALTSSG